MIVIVDYGMGNLGSIKNMVKKIGYDAIISSDPSDLLSAKKIILPGVGSFDNGVKNLDELGLKKIIIDLVETKQVQILGICLGMQLLGKTSDEGSLEGLGLIDGQVRKFDNNQIRVPHMGWNTVNLKKKSHLFKDMYNQENRFYFVHSYYFECNDEEDILTTTTYQKDFVSSLHKENIYGTQFHPEKSHKFGMSLLNNFLRG